MGELDIDAEDDKPDVYDPSDLEATRAREQGLGVGARDLARQRDPGGAAVGLDQREDESPVEEEELDAEDELDEE